LGKGQHREECPYSPRYGGLRKGGRGGESSFNPRLGGRGKSGKRRKRKLIGEKENSLSRRRGSFNRVA